MYLPEEQKTGNLYTINGDNRNPSSPHGMKIEVMTYPMQFLMPDGSFTPNIQDACISLCVMTDTKAGYEQGHGILLRKNDALLLIKVLSENLAKLNSEP